MLLSYRNQSIDLLCNQWTGFYMIPASIMKGLNKTKTELSAKKVRLLGHLSSVQRLVSNWIPISPLGFIPSTKRVEAALPPEVFSGNSTPKTCSKPIVEHPCQSASPLQIHCTPLQSALPQQHFQMAASKKNENLKAKDKHKQSKFQSPELIVLWISLITPYSLMLPVSISYW